MCASLHRLVRLQRRLGSRALLVHHLPNLLYLVGFRGSNGIGVVTGQEAVLFTDRRYQAAARLEVCGARVEIPGKDLLEAAVKWLRRRRPARVFYEADHITAAELRRLEGNLGRELSGAPSPLRIESFRAVKEAGEIAALRAAAELAARVFEEILPSIRPGVRERELAAEIEYRMKRYGAHGPGFETIVASGPRAALPHGHASQKRLGKNELVVFDLGAILGDYHSDMTRTVYLGRPPARVRRLYGAVEEALHRARESVRGGVEARRVDGAARRTLTRRGLGRYFLHGTGHGVGLEIHEEPRIGPGTRERLRAGQVITLEPGVYLPPWGGVRIEDLVVVRASGAETLTPLSTELIWL